MQKFIKKYIPQIFLLIILIGVFSPLLQTRAQTPTPPPSRADAAAAAAAQSQAAAAKAAQDAAAQKALTDREAARKSATAPSGSALYDSLSGCPPVDGCIAIIIYWLFYSIPSFLLGVVANFFDVMIALAVQSDLYNKATFIGNAWAIVRDLSNIFFILILLYVAVQTILGLSHEAKKVIVHVIIMALLINFSMFFTKIVIDSSNVLALIFYNKINVTVVRNGVVGDTNYIPVLKGGADKDVAGKMMSYFDPTKILTADFFDKFRRSTYTFSAKGAALAAAGGALVGSWIPVVGTLAGGVVGVVGYALSGFSNSIPIAISIGFILIAGSIIIFAAYAFLIAGLSFLARMIELWILIIFSPFAFMSLALPFLADVKYIGWKYWIHSLLKVSFMAPIFMFFMYLIFMIIQSNIFTSLVDRTDPLKQGWMETIILMVIPALVILILLMKATKFAKEGSGALGEMVISGAKFAAGLAVGGVALGGASIGRSAIGGFMKGASTGDTAANRMAANRALLANPAAGRMDKIKAQMDIARGNLAQKTGFDRLQTWTGDKINSDQKHVEEAAHARHELDEAAGARFQGKKFNDLTLPERDEIRGRISKDAQGYKDYGKKYKELNKIEKAAIDGLIDPLLLARTSKADHLIEEARQKQGLGSSIMQSARTGSYDIRNLANVVAKEQSTGFAKIAMGLTGAMAMGMRGGFKQMGVNFGESKGEFFKDLGNTVSDALKSVKINVDLSHVGEVKKESGHGGGGGHH